MKLIGEINDLFSKYINPTIMKLSIINSLVYAKDDIGTFKNTIHILKSLGSTKHFYQSLKSTLKKAKINNEWAKLIYTHNIKKTITRCERLSTDVLQSLIETSNLNVYMAYMNSIGKSFDEELEQYYNYKWDSDEVKEYHKHIQTCITSYLDTLSEDEVYEIQKAKIQYDEARKLRGNAVARQKELEKQARLDKRKDDFEIALSRHCNNYLRTLTKESILDAINRNVQSKVLSLGFNNFINDSICCIAVYRVANQTYKLNNKNIKYVKGDNELGSAISTAKLFFHDTEKSTINNIVNYWRNNGYVVAVILLRDTQNFGTSLVGINQSIPYGLSTLQLSGLVNTVLENYTRWNRLTYTYITAIYHLSGGSVTTHLYDLVNYRNSLSTRLSILRKKYITVIEKNDIDEFYSYLLSISEAYNSINLIDVNDIISYNPIFKNYYIKLGNNMNALYNDIELNYPTYISNDKTNLSRYLKHIESFM